MLFFRVISHLLPRGDAWKLTITKTLRKFFLGLSEQPAETRIFIDKVYLDLFPETARSRDNVDPAEASGALEEWEKQYGLEPNGLEAARRLALAAEWRATGGQSPSYIQGVLRTAGFDVYVYDWWSSGPPYIARDPRDYTDQPLIGSYQCTGDGLASQPQCSDFASQPQCNNWLANEVDYLVNLDLTRRAPPPIPDDPAKWPYFMYVGGTPFGAVATIDITRRASFERLVLKVRPTHLWVVTIVDYAAVGGLMTEDDDFIIEEDGDSIVAES